MPDYTFLRDHCLQQRVWCHREGGLISRNKTMFEAACFVLAVLCSENRKKRNKIWQWTCSWLVRRGQYGLSILQRDLEVKYRLYFHTITHTLTHIHSFTYRLTHCCVRTSFCVPIGQSHPVDWTCREGRQIKLNMLVFLLWGCEASQTQLVVVYYGTIYEMKRSNLASWRTLSFPNLRDTLRRMDCAKIGLKSCSLNQALVTFSYFLYCFPVSDQPH